MALTKLAIERPLTVLMLIVALTIFGWRSFTLMQVDRFPQVDFPVVTISVFYPGASPDDVESQVVRPIEDAVAGIPGIDVIQGVANESVGFVVAQFKETVTGDNAAIDVERQVAAIKNQLPNDAEAPSVSKVDFNAFPIMDIIVTGPQSQDELAAIANDLVKDRLQAVSGVASVSVFGGRDSIVAIDADPNQMAAYGITLGLLQQAFGSNNLSFPVGSLEEGNTKTSVRSVGSFQSLAEIENMVVKGGPGGPGGGPPSPTGADDGGYVYLRDVAQVKETLVDTTVLQRYNGQDTVAIGIIKATEANAIDVADGVLDQIERLNKDLPGGAELTVVRDDSQFTRNSVAAVEEDLILAILITGLFMLLFLHTIRSTLVVVVAIPVALVSTFTVMWAFGFTLNVLTLLALTLIIGIMVDDSIVVVENTERHLKQLGKSPKKAAFDGRKEIALAGLSITMVDVIVYIPVAYTSGIIGQFFRSYGITIAAAALFSLFGSFTLVPLMLAYVMKDPNKKEVKRKGLAGMLGKLGRPIGWLWEKFIILWEGAFTTVANAYAILIRVSLKNILTQFIVFSLAVATLIVTAITLGPQIGFEFIPQEDNAQFNVAVEMPPGTNLDTTNMVARQLEQIILQNVPETVSILTRVGASGGGGFAIGSSDSNTAQLTVAVTNKNDRTRTLFDITNELRANVSSIPDATVTVSTASGVGPGGSPIQVRITGPDPDVATDLANQVAEIMRNTPGTVDVLNNDAVRSPELKIELDRARLSAMGLSPAVVGSTLRTAIVGGDVGDYDPGLADAIEINLRINETAREDLEAILQLPIGYLDGKPVLLGQVGTVSRSEAPATITRINRERVLTVGSNVTGSDIGGISRAVEEKINNSVVFPPDYNFEFGGDVEQQQESFGQLGNSLLLAFVLIYILLVALYQSFLQPFVIMFSLPMSWIGVFVGLYLSENTFNIFSILGLIMLTGLVSRNAILIIDFANQLREEGLDRKAALIEAGRLRLRPVVMTAGTLVVALMPVLLSTADGSETRQPLAAVLMGGAVSSGFMTLIVVPVVYIFFDSVSNFLKWLFVWITGAPPEEEQDTQKAGTQSPQTAPPAEAIGGAASD